MIDRYLVSTGKIIKEYLDEYKINQKELSNRTGISEKHISNVLNGNSRLTEKFALKLEKVLTDIKASYWLNYEVKYREYIARQEELTNLEDIDLKYIAKKFRFKEVFNGLDLNLKEQAIEMLKLLKISDFNQFEKVYGDIAIEFMEDGGEKEAIAIWLNLCESEIEIQNSDIENVEFNIKNLKDNIDKIMILANNEDTEKSLSSFGKLCNLLGIYFVKCEAITNSKVRGALTTYKEHPAIYISGRFKSHAYIWFAIIHEIAHLILHYNKKETIISFEDDNKDKKELEANNYAREIFINKKEYERFVNQNIFTKKSILKFSKSQNILPKFSVGFLQHDELIDYSKFNYL